MTINAFPSLISALRKALGGENDWWPFGSEHLKSNAPKRVSYIERIKGALFRLAPSSKRHCASVLVRIPWA